MELSNLCGYDKNNNVASFFGITMYFELDIKQIEIKILFLFDVIDQLVNVNILERLKIEKNCNII